MIRVFGHRVDTPSDWADPAAYTAKNLQFHRDICDAVRRHDAKAARRAMRVHMRQAGKNLLTRFDWLQQHHCAGDNWAEDFPDSMRESICDVQNRDESPSLNSYLGNGGGDGGDDG